MRFILSLVFERIQEEAVVLYLHIEMEGMQPGVTMPVQLIVNYLPWDLTAFGLRSLFCSASGYIRSNIVLDKNTGKLSVNLSGFILCQLTGSLFQGKVCATGL